MHNIVFNWRRRDSKVLVVSRRPFHVLAASYRNERRPVSVWNVGSLSSSWDEDRSVRCGYRSYLISMTVDVSVWSWIALWRSWTTLLLWWVASGAGQVSAWCDHADEWKSSELAEVGQRSLLTCRRALRSCNSPILRQNGAGNHVRRIDRHRSSHLTNTADVVITSSPNFSYVLVERETRLPRADVNEIYTFRQNTSDVALLNNMYQNKFRWLVYKRFGQDFAYT